jgi:hypothetical protein
MESNLLDKCFLNNAYNKTLRVLIAISRSLSRPRFQNDKELMQNLDGM